MNRQQKGTTKKNKISSKGKPISLTLKCFASLNPHTPHWVNNMSHAINKAPTSKVDAPNALQFFEKTRGFKKLAINGILKLPARIAA